MSLGACVCGGDPDGGLRDGGADDGGLRDAGEAPDGFTADGGGDPSHTFPARDFLCDADSSTPCETTIAARSEATRTVTVPATLDDATFLYLVRSLRVPQSSGGITPGFNLDGLDSGAGGSGTCEERAADFESDLDPLHIGVDDAIAGLIPTVEALYDSADCPAGDTSGCGDYLIAQRIEEGSLLLAVEYSPFEGPLRAPPAKLT